MVAQREQRDKLSTMGEMAAVLAHEIKNPMNSIIIHLEVLKACLEELDQNSPHRTKASRNLEVIQGEMKRLEKVITGFLDLATPTPAGQSLFDLNVLIAETVDLLKLELTAKGIQLELDLEPELPPLMGSSDKLKQAILNLMINASQALNSGGTIKLSTGFDEKLLYIKISDNGSGIPANIRSQIFSPYFTTKEKGSGLGLAIVRRIVRDHGGYVDVESEEGQGAQFQLFFPMCSRSE